LADVATIGILQHRAQRRAETVATQLQTALNSRVSIEQAKGILAERLGVPMEEAFITLRAHARAHHRHLSELAQAVVAGTEDVSAMSGPDAQRTVLRLRHDRARRPSSSFTVGRATAARGDTRWATEAAGCPRTWPPPRRR
jgi:ANTAR domain